MNLLPHGGLALSSLDDHILQPGIKGLPLTAPLRQGAIARQHWNILRADTSFPVAILKHSALLHNLAAMSAFCERHGALLAPHGKTTMSPQLFGAQLANGAWGITLATASQVRLAHRFGVRRVLLANQLVAPADIASMLDLLHDDPAFELLALVDSNAGVERLAAAVALHPLARPLPLLVELGMLGQRAGCRSDDAALALAHAVARAPGLQLAGFEGYEGLQMTGDHTADVAAVNAYLTRLVGLTCRADGEQLFMGRAEIVVSAGGSGYFDLVARAFAQLQGLTRPVRPILRSGCYLTSDHGTYLRQLGQLDQREAVAGQVASTACEACHGDAAAADTGATRMSPAPASSIEFAFDLTNAGDRRAAPVPPAANVRGDSYGAQVPERAQFEAVPPAADVRSESCGAQDINNHNHPATGLLPALEVWTMVQSRPEPTLAILTMGKRDASHDIELPLPLLHHRPGADINTAPLPLPPGCTIFKMNDQHAYLRLPDDAADLLAVGDLVGCGISHPCTTFDKWPLLLAVDDDYTVAYGINTFF